MSTPARLPDRCVACGEQRLGWRLDELSERYGASETVWRERIADRSLIARKIGPRTYVVLQPDLDAFLEASRTDRPSAASKAVVPLREVRR